jgi:CheY-like chemotaxis protein
MLSLNEWKVIAVDDDADSLRLMQMILEAQGIKVFPAADGNTFRLLWRTLSPTLVLMDLAMPAPDGWTLVKEAAPAGHRHRIPFIAVTAYHSDMVMQAALRAGFTTIIPKPIRAGSFVETLRKILEDHTNKR